LWFRPSRDIAYLWFHSDIAYLWFPMGRRKEVRRRIEELFARAKPQQQRRLLRSMRQAFAKQDAKALALIQDREHCTEHEAKIRPLQLRRGRARNLTELALALGISPSRLRAMRELQPWVQACLGKPLDQKKGKPGRKKFVKKFVGGKRGLRARETAFFGCAWNGGASARATNGELHATRRAVLGAPSKRARLRQSNSSINAHTQEMNDD
jgi:hypothetical protein